MQPVAPDTTGGETERRIERSAGATRNGAVAICHARFGGLWLERVRQAAVQVDRGHLHRGRHHDSALVERTRRELHERHTRSGPGQPTPRDAKV